MTNLLSANRFRLKKNRLFWVCLLISAFAGLWQPFGTYMNYKRGYPLDTSIFVYTMLIGLLLSVFLPLFFGAEYSDGAIRNKLAAGHTRLSLYLSNLITAVAAALLFCGTYLLFTFAVGVPLLGLPVTPAGQLLTTLGCSLLMVAAWCAIFLLFNMNLSRKAASAVSCMLLFLLLFLVATWVFAKLDAPKFWPAYDLTVDGQMTTEIIPNPTYLTADQRPLYEFLLDLNPMGQGIQYIDMSPARPLQLALCSLGVFAAATAAGLALFQRKDLK